MSGNDIQINDVVMINPELAEALGSDPYAEYTVINIMSLLGDTRAFIRFEHGNLRAIPLSDLIKVDLTKPDDFIYPDTPAGTKIIAIRDTESLLGIDIPKGVVLTLGSYTHRYYKNAYHRVKENRDFMITGYGALSVPFEDFRIKVD